MKLKKEINEIKKLEEQINRNYLIQESSKHVYDFRRFRTRRSFVESISKTTISKADKKQSNLLDAILNFNYRVRPRSKAEKKKKQCF